VRRALTSAGTPDHCRGGHGRDELDAALGGLRAAGWPAPEDPDGDDDAELDGRDLICDRLLDEVGWLRQCPGWLTHLYTKGFPSAVNLRPEGDRPERLPPRRGSMFRTGIPIDPPLPRV
jgi:hypothetical protein